MIDPLDLQGPVDRIQGAVDQLRAGRCVLTSTEGRGPALTDRLDLALANQGYRILPLGVDHTYEQCADHLGVSSIADPARLLNNPSLNRLVLQLDCRSASWRDWSNLVLQRLAGGVPVECLRFWLIWPDSVRRPAPKILSALDWVGCVTPTDARIFAADRFRERQGPAASHYWETLAVELAGPDLDLIERLSAVAGPMLDPVGWLKGCTLTPHPTLPFDNQPKFESPITLAARTDGAAADELRRRIWSAQVKALFPALDAERGGVLAPFKRLLETSYKLRPDDDVAVIPRDVEWGPAFGRLFGDRSVPDSVKSFLMVARDVRNDIAHCEPVSPQRLQELLNAAAVTIKNRWVNS